MNTNNNKLAPLMAVATAMVLVGMSGTALAGHVDTSQADNGSPFAYIGLGIGDHVTACVGGWTDITVDVENPTDGNPVGPFPVTVPVGSGGINNNAPLPCLGGAVATSAGGTLPSDWTAWADDAVYNAATSGLIVPAGFARLTVTDSVPGNACTPVPVTGFGPAGGTDVCEGTSSQSTTGVATQFSFCGQGSGKVDSVVLGTSPLAGAPGVTTTVTRAVFLAGPIFFGFDCTIAGAATGTVAGAYDNSVQPTFNGTPVCQGAGPFPDPTPGGLLSNGDGTIDDPLNAGEDLTVTWIACLFPFPSTGASCFGDSAAYTGHLASFGLIGTIGWFNGVGNNMTCQDGVTSAYGNVSGGGNTVGISNFPVQVTFNP